MFKQYSPPTFFVLCALVCIVTYSKWEDIACAYKESWGKQVADGLGTALQTGRWRVRFPMVSLKIFIDIIIL